MFDFFYGFGETINPDVKPEIAYQYEVGIKHFYTRSFVQLATYYYDYKDKIVQQVDDGIYENIASSTHKGFELKYSAKYGKNNLNASYGYSDAKDQDDKRLDSIPKHKITLSNKFKIDSKTSASIDYLYQSKTYQNSENYKVDGFSQ